MAYSSKVGAGILEVYSQLASDLVFPLTFSDQVFSIIEAAELATFGEYELYESDADAATVYQLVRDGVKAISPRPEGAQSFIDWLDAAGATKAYTGGSGSTTSALVNAARDSGETLAKVPEKIGKLGGGLGALAAGAALFLFVWKR